MRSTIVTAVLAASLVGCGGRDPDIDLRPFSSCADLEDSIIDQAVTEIRWEYAWGFGGGLSFGSAEYGLAESMPQASDDGVSNSSGRSNSNTNTQEVGVDEADLVKTDGDNLYSIAGQTLVVTAAWPPESTEMLGQVELEGDIEGFYLLEDSKAIVMSQLWYSDGAPSDGSTHNGNGGLVKVTVVDLSDAESPVVLRETYTRGVLHDSRMKGDMLYVVSYRVMQLDGLREADGKSEALDVVRSSTLEDWMPRRYDHLRNSASAAWEASEEDVCECTSVYGSDRASGDMLVSVQSLDTSDPLGRFDGTGVLSSLDHIYGSADAIYVVSSEATEGPWQSYDDRIETIIHKFRIDLDDPRPIYTGSGDVPGWTLNQFSLDEHEGRLRVATTTSAWEGGSGTSGVYVMEDDGDELDIVGSVEGLAEGESIYSVRFVEDTGYVVTFEQIDPLFVIDLSNPEAPEARGELHITGFSNYLHPMEDGLLLGIGLDIEANGWESNGVQVSMFDVSDLDNPTLASRLTLEDSSYSDAQYEHHAFNYFATTESLVVPAYSNDWGESRMHVIHVAPGEDLEEIGTISQSDILVEDDWSYRYCTEFKRSVVFSDEEAGDFVYAVSAAGVVVAEVDDPSTLVSSVPFVGVDPCADSNGGGYDYEAF